MAGKITFLGLILLWLSGISSFAAFVNIETAGEVAVNFYRIQYYKNFSSIPNLNTPEIYTKYSGEKVVYYICKFSDKGFVIVSADDNAYPVIGYSFEDNLSGKQNPPSFENWMKNVESQIIMASEKTGKSEYSAVWEKYLNDNPSEIYNKGQFKSVSPLLTLRWDQGNPYNLQCPSNSAGPGGHCLTGCVATAMAQIMKYWNYPEFGKDSILYTGNNNLVFEKTYYNWDAMTNTINTNSPDSCKNAIAELMFHCGVTVNMMYGPYASGTFTELVPDALMHYFRYHPSVGYLLRNNISDYDWDLMVRDNLDNGMPVLYSGEGTGGHAFVCDGYNDPCFYHFNWGWSGYANGYFYYNDLTPGGNNFSQGQGAVFNIMPYFAPYCRGGKVMTDLYRSFGDGSTHSFYWNNTSCDWLISVPEPDAKIKLEFSLFDTELNSDYVKIYDGTDSTAALLGSFSGNQLPPSVISSGGNMYIVFTSDETIQYQGWEAYYDVRFCRNGNILTQPYGSFGDGSGNFYCWNNSFCEWLIQPPDQAEKITLIFDTFSTEDNKDLVRVYDGEDSLAALLGVFSGGQIPDTVVSTAGKMYVVFTTDKNIRSQGWEADYYSGEVNIADNYNNSLYTVYPNPVRNEIYLKIVNGKQLNRIISIYNITGELVYSINVKPENSFLSVIPVSDLPGGFYLLKVKSEEGELVRKFVKE